MAPKPKKAAKCEDEEGEEDIIDKGDEKYDGGKQFVDNYLTGNVIKFGVDWFEAPPLKEMLDLIKDKFIDKKKRRFNISAVCFDEPVIIDINIKEDTYEHVYINKDTD